jgi:predicted HTH transcriptional regulator
MPALGFYTEGISPQNSNFENHFIGNQLMTPEQLLKLLQQDENIKLEFKEGFDLKTSYGKAKFIKEMLALANSPGNPAYLLIGIEDKTKNPIGMGDIKEETLQQIIEDNCKPTIRFSFESVKIKDIEIGVITIPHSTRKPHTLRKKFGYSDSKGKQSELSDKQVFIRRGSVIYEASVEEIIEMAQEEEDYNEYFLNELQNIRAALDVISEHSYSWLGKDKNKVAVELLNLHSIANTLELIASALWPIYPNIVIQGGTLGALIGGIIGGFVAYGIRGLDQSGLVTL